MGSWKLAAVTLIVRLLNKIIVTERIKAPYFVERYFRGYLLTLA